MTIARMAMTAAISDSEKAAARGAGGCGGTGTEAVESGVSFIVVPEN